MDPWAHKQHVLIDTDFGNGLGFWKTIPTLALNKNNIHVTMNKYQCHLPRENSPVTFDMNQLCHLAYLRHLRKVDFPHPEGPIKRNHF